MSVAVWLDRLVGRALTFVKRLLSRFQRKQETRPMNDNRHDWLTVLSGLSPRIDALNLVQALPQRHYGPAAAAKNGAAYNLSASPPHNVAVARWIEALPAATTDAQLKKLLGDLTDDRSRTTYGAFSELAACGAFAEKGLLHRIQVPMTGTDILNPNGSDLDGEIQLNNDILFDVKGFGLQDYLIEELVKRLTADLAPDVVAPEGSWDVPVSTLETLLGSPGYDILRTELAAGPHTRARRSTLEFVRKPNRKVRIDVSETDPYRAAEQHADYAFRFAKQFPRHRPFLLVFVYHPWMGGLGRHMNFGGSTDTFLRAFARRTFLQFRNDRTNQHFGTPRADASRLLSGMLFLDAWQDAGAPGDPAPARLFLNPNADHPLTDLDRHAFGFANFNVTIDDFRHDDY